MKKVILVFMLLLSIISFGSVEIINTKDKNGKLTGGKSVVYKDNTVTLELEYKNNICTAIVIKTSKFANAVDEFIIFSVDDESYGTIEYKVQKDKKTIRCDAKDEEIVKDIAKGIEKGNKLMFDYEDKNCEAIIIEIELAEIQKAIKKLKVKK